MGEAKFYYFTCLKENRAVFTQFSLFKVKFCFCIQGTMAIHLTNENIWFDQYKFMDAERDYYSKLAQRLVGGDAPVAAASRAKSPLIEQITQARSRSPLVEQIVHARQQIHQSLAAPAKSGGGDGGVAVVDLTNRLQKLELENAELKQVTNDLKNMVTKLSSRVEQLEKKSAAPAPAAAAPAAAPAPAKAAPPANEEAEKVKQERLAAYAAKKVQKASTYRQILRSLG